MTDKTGTEIKEGDRVFNCADEAQYVVSIGLCGLCIENHERTLALTDERAKELVVMLGCGR